jgi:hypothetical protein
MLPNETSVEITWSCEDQTPWSYQILLQNEVINSGVWTGDDITYLFVRLSFGEWNLTLIVEDVFGNNASDSVLITINNADNFILFIGVSVLGGTVSLLVIIYLLKKRSR